MKKFYLVLLCFFSLKSSSNITVAVEIISNRGSLPLGVVIDNDKFPGQVVILKASDDPLFKQNQAAVEKFIQTMKEQYLSISFVVMEQSVFLDEFRD